MRTEEDVYMLEAVGASIHKCRKDCKLSLRDLENLCGLDNSKLAKIEKGQIDITLTTLLQICKGLDILPSLLMEKYNPDFSIENSKRKQIGNKK